MIVLPAMPSAQQQVWEFLLDLYEREPDGWTLIGGQMVHLLCAERGYAPQRPTEDADTVVNAREPHLLGAVSAALIDFGFKPDPSADGRQHRWRNGEAIFDVLVPEGMGERAENRPSASGFPSISTPGGTQALNRSETVAVDLGHRQGYVNRPSLLGAMILKAAAWFSTTGTNRVRHCHDFAALAACLATSDLNDSDLAKKDCKRLRAMITATLDVPEALDANPLAERRLARLTEHIG